MGLSSEVVIIPDKKAEIVNLIKDHADKIDWYLQDHKPEIMKLLSLDCQCVKLFCRPPSRTYDDFHRNDIEITAYFRKNYPWGLFDGLICPYGTSIVARVCTNVFERIQEGAKASLVLQVIIFDSRVETLIVKLLTEYANSVKIPKVEFFRKGY